MGYTHRGEQVPVNPSHLPLVRFPQKTRPSPSSLDGDGFVYMYSIEERPQSRLKCTMARHAGGTREH